jgi:hypothetical protein
MKRVLEIEWIETEWPVDRLEPIIPPGEGNMKVVE